MEKLIKIISSPFNPNMEVAGDLSIHLHVPYSENEVTVKINSGLQDYKENQDQKDIQIRQLTVTEDTNETRTLTFNFTSNNIHVVEINGKKYTIRLMSIGKENIQGLDFPFFEFLVSF